MHTNHKLPSFTACVSSPVAQFINSGDRSKNGDVNEPYGGCSDINHIGQGDMASGEEMLEPWGAEDMTEDMTKRVYDRNMGLLRPGLTREQVVVKVLHMIRCQQITEFNEKLYIDVPTCFFRFNIAFFDLDKECK